MGVAALGLAVVEMQNSGEETENLKSGATEVLQKELCKKYSAEFLRSPAELKVGIAANVRDGITPIHGLRHPPKGDTTGWYVYAGPNISSEPGFFKPLHVAHLDNCCPQISKYLGLSPSWRFLVAGDYEDVWFDESLLDSE